MKRTKSFTTVIAVILAVSLLAGCAGSGSDAKDSGENGRITRSDARPDRVFATRTQEFPQGKITAEIYPVQVVDDHVVVVIDYSLEGPKSVYLKSAMGFDYVLYHYTFDPVRLVDLAGNRVWTLGKHGYNPVVSNSFHQSIELGETLRTVSMFGAPDTPTVDVLLYRFGLIENVPVIQGDESTPTVESLRLSGEISFPDPTPIRTYIEAYDKSKSVQSSGKEQTVTIASDVLFATDQDVLGAEAEKVIDEAAAAIKKTAGSGQIQIVGHTDDVASDEYNLDLSRRRAASVAKRLGSALGSAFILTTDGKGKSEPVVEGTSDEARAQNRRVEIRFTASSTPVLPGGDIPEATVPVAVGHDEVEMDMSKYFNSVRSSYQGEFWKVSVSKVVRRDGYLVGTIMATRKTDVCSPGYLQSSGLFAGQPYGLYNSSCSLYLLSANGKVFPAQYTVPLGHSEGYVWHGLADSSFSVSEGNTPIVGGKIQYTVIWPDPDPGAKAISIEDKGMFRIVDIPVENG